MNCRQKRIARPYNDDRPFLCRAMNPPKPPKRQPPLDTSPEPLEVGGRHENISRVPIDEDLNKECALLQGLPPEIRLLIWRFVVGGDEFCLITIPWKLTTAPYIDIVNCGLSSHDHATASNLSRYHIERIGIAAGEPLVRRRTALLKSCRQIYHEAIDLLYSTNTFVLNDIPTMMMFSKSVLRRRLNAIRSLRLVWSPRFIAPYPYVESNLPAIHIIDCFEWGGNIQWTRFWEVITGMQGLKELYIHLEYQVVFRLHEESHTEEHILRPLLKLRGLRRFELTFNHIWAGPFVEEELVCKEFRKELHRVARKPRVMERQEVKVPMLKYRLAAP